MELSGVPQCCRKLLGNGLEESNIGSSVRLKAVHLASYNVYISCSHTEAEAVSEANTLFFF